MKNVKNKIAITGIVGSGKSTVTKIFQDLNYAIFDSDVCTSNLYEDEDVITFLKDKFNESFEDGIFIKEKLSKLVFSNNQKLKELNDFMHPLIEAKMQEAFLKNDITVSEVPLLFEANLQHYFDIIIVVYSDLEIIKERLIKRGYTKQKINNIINKQIPLDEKVNKATVVFDNNSDQETLKKKVEIWIKENLE